MSTRDGTIQLTSNLDPTPPSSNKGRVYWRDDLKEFWQIDDAGIKSSLFGAVAWGNIGGELSDQTDLYSKIRNGQLAIKQLSDISSFLVGSSYELPSGRYVFDGDLNIGTNNFKLIDGAFYTFKFSNINSITYTGTGPMFDATVSGSAIKMDDGFLNAPNCSEVILMTDGNSLLMTLVIIVAKKWATITDTGFVTLNDMPILPV